MLNAQSSRIFKRLCIDVTFLNCTLNLQASFASIDLKALAVSLRSHMCADLRRVWNCAANTVLDENCGGSTHTVLTASPVFHVITGTLPRGDSFKNQSGLLDKDTSATVKSTCKIAIVQQTQVQQYSVEGLPPWLS